MGLIPQIQTFNIEEVNRALRKLATSKLGPTAIPTFAGAEIGTLTLADGSITDSGGAISFGDEDLSTSGTLTLSSLTPGSVLFAGTGGVISEDNDGVFWNDTLKRFSINTNTPSGVFSVGSAVGEDAYFFYDNADVGDTTDGQSVYIYRRAAEADSFIRFYIDEFKQAIIDAGDTVFRLRTARSLFIGDSATSVDFQRQANGPVNFFFSGFQDNEFVNIYGYDLGAVRVKYGRFQVDDAGDFNIEAESGEVMRFLTGGTERVTIDNSGNVGFGGELAPETLLELTHATPTITGHCNTHSDVLDARAVVYQAFGEQSGGEETTLGKHLFAHDSASDDEKAYWKLFINTGSDGDSPTQVLEIGSDLMATFAGIIHANNKVQFTQVDGNEYIDSLADGYMDYRATTAHRFGDGTNQTVFAANGLQTMAGTAKVKVEIIAGADSIHKGSSAPDDVYLANAMHTLAFDKNIVQHGHYSTIIPEAIAAGTDIDIEIDWSFLDVEADHYMTWVIEYVLIADGEDPAKAITRTYQKSVISTGNNDKQIHTEFGTGITGAVADDTLMFSIYRDADATYDTDDLDQDALLLAIHLHYIADKLGKGT